MLPEKQPKNNPECSTLSIRYKRNPFLVQGSISLIFSKVFSQISLKNSPILKTLRVHFS